MERTETTVASPWIPLATRRFARREVDPTNLYIIGGLVLLLVVLLAARKIISMHEEEKRRRAYWRHIRDVCRERGLGRDAANRFIRRLRLLEVRNPEHAVSSLGAFEHLVADGLAKAEGQAFCAEVRRALFQNPASSGAHPVVARDGAVAELEALMPDLLDLPDRGETEDAEAEDVPDVAAPTAAAGAPVRPPSPLDPDPGPRPEPGGGAPPEAPPPAQAAARAPRASVKEEESETTTRILEATETLRLWPAPHGPIATAAVLAVEATDLLVMLTSDGMPMPEIGATLQGALVRGKVACGFQSEVSGVAGGVEPVFRLSHARMRVEALRRPFAPGRWKALVELHPLSPRDLAFAASSLDPPPDPDPPIRAVLRDCTVAGCAFETTEVDPSFEVGAFVRFALPLGDHAADPQVVVRIERVGHGGVRGDRQSYFLHGTFAGLPDAVRDRIFRGVLQHTGQA